MEAMLSALAGLLGGIVIGAVWTAIAMDVPSPYADWLGKRCWVRPCAREVWKPCVVVAVSWRGAVCVRELARQDENGYWVQKENVSWRVRFGKPKDAVEEAGES